MLNICTGTGKYGSETRHTEIAIDGADCPACAALKKLAIARQELTDANKAIQQQDEKIAGMELDLALLRSRVAVAEAPEAVEVVGRGMHPAIVADTAQVPSVNPMFDAMFDAVFGRKAWNSR